MVVLATAATVIASQAVISGAFSMSRQAVQLGFLPPLTVSQTSDEEQGQIYLPFVNAALFVVVLVLMVTFGSSQRLATAYGVSVTGALLIDTLLLLSVARILFGWSTWKLVLAGVAFGGTEAAFLSANFTKIIHGGWLPLLIAAVMFTVMTTWQRGRQLIIRNRTEVEGSLLEFVGQLPDQHLVRVPGTAVFPHPSSETTPLALRANVEHNGVLHEHVVIVSAQAQNVPHVPLDQQVTVDDLGNPDDGIVFVSIKYGFADRPDLPGGPRRAAGQHARDALRPRHRVLLPLPGHPAGAAASRGCSGGARCCSSAWPTTPPTRRCASTCPPTAPSSWAPASTSEVAGATVRWVSGAEVSRSWLVGMPISPNRSAAHGKRGGCTNIRSAAPDFQSAALLMLVAA